MTKYFEVYRIFEVRTDRATYRIEAVESYGEFEARIYEEVRLSDLRCQNSDLRFKGDVLHDQDPYIVVYRRVHFPGPITADSAERVIEKATNCL